VTGGGVSDSDMPSLPWTTRQDVSSVEDTSLAALLAGSGLPADADPELRPVADVLAELTARPAGDELTGLAAAQAEFRHHVFSPAQVRQSPHRRPGRLVSRLGLKIGAAAAVVAMGLGGAAAVAYAGALPSSWQQFAHQTIGAPAHVAGRDTPAGKSATRSAAHFRHTAGQTHRGRPPAGRPPAGLRFLPHARPPLPAGLPVTWPFPHRSGLPGAPLVRRAFDRPARTERLRPLVRA
jgi:hypothetical protein